MFYRIKYFSLVSGKLAYLHLSKYLLCISFVLIYYVIFTDDALADQQTPAVMGISSADCILSERRTLADDTTHVDTAVSTTITSGQEILADNPPPATNVVLLTACGLITLVGDMSHVVSSSNRSAKQTANITNEAPCMYSSSNADVVSLDDSDYIPSDCSFVSDSDSCSIGRSVEIPLLQNTTDMGSGTSSITRNIPNVQSHEAVVATADTTVTQTGHDVSHIEVIATSNDDGRKYDKQTYCYFCKKPQLKIARHLRTVHKSEEEVENYINETDVAKKNLQLLKLRNMGNHEHNMNVVKKKAGKFVVQHRPKTDDVDHRHYVPCKYCFAYIAKQSLWKHSCPLSPECNGDKGKKTRHHKSGASMVTEGESADFSFLQGMRDDKIGKVAKTDGLILQLGTHLSRKMGNQKEQHGYIRGRMRHLGRLLVHLRDKTGNGNGTLRDFIHPTKFRMVVDAAQHCAGFDSRRHSYTSPSSAIRSGQLLKKVAQLNMTRALETGDTATVDTSTNFLKLCEMQWSEVTASAHRNLSERNRNGVDFLPLTEDVMKLNGYLKEEGDRNTAILVIGKGDDMTNESYAELAQLTLAKLTLFNRKRQGEVSKITVQDWSNRKKAVADQAMAQSLNQFEQNLLSVLERLEIKGKRGRIVPILITAEIAEWVKILLEHRHKFIAEDNQYLFANTGNSYHRGCDVLRKYASLCGAQRPHLLTTTRLRKHVASLAQVLALKEHEMDMLASFMGHDLRIHREFYRMPLDVLQVAKVSKVFLACEEGRINEFAGKCLSDINLDSNEVVYLEDSDDDSEDGERDEGNVSVLDTSSTVTLPNRKRNKTNEPCSTMPKKKHTQQSDQQSAMGEHEDIDQTETTSPTHIGMKRKARYERIAWTKEEKHAVKMHFASDIIRKVLPGKERIEEFLNEHHWSRSWRKVKDHLRNTYMKPAE